jgi:hypothetical protein
LDKGEKPMLYINSPRYFFNITNYGNFENIRFSGINAFAAHSNNPSAYLRYFPVLLCEMSATPVERAGLMRLKPLYTQSTIGFKYDCSDPFYEGSLLPTNSSLNYKCTSTNTVA